MTHDQLAGLLSALTGISILVASFFQWFDVTYHGALPLRRWVKVLFVVLIAALIGSLVALFWPSAGSSVAHSAHRLLPVRGARRGPYVGRPVEPVLRVQRDPWDWVLFSLSVLAALAAAVALSTWWSRLRRVPEVGFRWETPDGNPWIPNQTFALQPRISNFRVILDNVGAAAASLVVVNVIVPHFLEIESKNDDGSPRNVHEASEVAVGCPPDHKVRFFVAQTETFVPGIAVIFRFRVTVPASLPTGTPRNFYFAVSAESERFSRSGHLLIPSLGVVTNPAFWLNEKWPGKRHPWWPPRRIKTSPGMTVRAGPGRRIDRRQVVLDVQAPTLAGQSGGG